MALLSYGETLGLAYVHDFKGYNDEMARQEQMTAAKKAQDTQKSMWVADKLKLGKTYTKYDSDQLKKFSLERYEKVGKIVNSNDWETNPMALAFINQNAEELLDNEHVQRSARAHQYQQMLVKDLSDPKYADDEDAAELMKLKLEAWSNYEKTGNVDGIEGAPVKEFTYTSPTLFDLNDRLNEVSKYAGKRTKGYDNGSFYGTKEYIANLDALATGEITGPHERSVEREYQQYIEQTKDQITKLDWMKEQISQRVSLDMTMSQKSQPSGNGRGDDESKATFSPVDEFVKSRLSTDTNKMLRAGSSFIDTDVSNAQVFIKGGKVPVDGKPGSFTYNVSSRNGVLATRPGDGKLYQMNDMSGKTVQITPINQIRSVKIGNTVHRYAMARMFVSTDKKSEQLKGLEEHGGYYPGHPKYEENSKDEWVKQTGMREVKDKDGVVLGTEIMTLLPIEFGGERDYLYNNQHLGQTTLEAGHVATAAYESELIQHAQGMRIGEQFQDQTGKVYEVQQNGIPKRVK